MNESVQQLNQPLPQNNGLQLLRDNEVYLLRAMNRMFVNRRKNLYRMDILTHVSTDMVVAALSHPDFADAKKGEDSINQSFECFKALGIIVRAEQRSKYHEYKQKNEGLEQAVRYIGFKQEPTIIHTFDAVLTNKIVRLLHSIEYMKLDSVILSLEVGDGDGLIYSQVVQVYEQITELLKKKENNEIQPLESTCAT